MIKVDGYRSDKACDVETTRGINEAGQSKQAQGAGGKVGWLVECAGGQDAKRNSAVGCVEGQRHPSQQYRQCPRPLSDPGHAIPPNDAMFSCRPYPPPQAGVCPSRWWWRRSRSTKPTWNSATASLTALGRGVEIPSHHMRTADGSHGLRDHRNSRRHRRARLRAGATGWTTVSVTSGPARWSAQARRKVRPGPAAAASADSLASRAGNATVIRITAATQVTPCLFSPDGTDDVTCTRDRLAAAAGQAPGPFGK